MESGTQDGVDPQTSRKGYWRTDIAQGNRSRWLGFRTKENKVFQIESYGSKDRETPGKAGQRIQFEETSAKRLLKILSKEFG